MPLETYRQLLTSNPALRQLLLALGVSALGDAAQLTAVLWLATATPSPGSTASLFVMAIAGATVLSSPWAGVWADRTADRRQVMVVANLLRAFLSLALTVSTSQVVLVVLLLLCTVAAENVVSATAYAAIPDLVRGERRIVRANALLGAIEQACFVGGTAIGAMLVAIQPWLPFAMNAAAFALAAVALGSIAASALSVPHDHDASAVKTMAAARDGLRFIKQSRRARTLVVSGAIATVGFAGTPIAMVVLLADQLAGGPTAFGAVQMGTTVGLLMGAALAGRLSNRPGAYLLIGYAVLTAFTAALGWAPSVGMVLVVATLRGGSNGVISVLGNSMLQLAAPSQFRGRTLATARGFYETARLAALPGAGLLVDSWGARSAFLVMASLLLAAGAVAALAVRSDV